MANARRLVPSQISRAPMVTPHSLCAFAKIASKTGARSSGEELMTPKTSAVAVCCSSAFGQKPRVLDCDDRLVGEGGNEFDLPLGEWVDPLPR